MLQHEIERNKQLRLKAGQAFMKALDDPNYNPSGGKAIDEIYVPSDDNALMRLINKIDAEGGADLEGKLFKYGDKSKYISQA